MASPDCLDAAQVRAAVVAYRDALRAHQDALNRLNVYPVPDGDTGTNMALTLESVVAEIDGAGSMAEVCKAMSHGSLMGARGNSGVILSQILRGVATTFEAGASAGPATVAAALETAADAAYAAVGRPVEGTILTVCRAAAAAAAAAKAAGRAAGGAGSIASSASLVDVLDAARAGAADALARTPDLLPVLAQAGVVDAGGAGFVLLLDALLWVVAGRPVEPPPSPNGAALPAAAGQPAGRATGGGGGPGAGDRDVGHLRFEVMFFLDAPDDTIPRFREVWAGVGDSIVVVGGDGIWNCHIHTDDIGAVIEAALDCGRPKDIRVTDLRDQLEEERWVREAEAGASGDDATDEHRRQVPCAVVAVGTGDGIRRIFRSLGVQQIVAGGQSMNPSTAQIIEAVEAAPAGEVVVLPNNKNVIPVAEQAAAATGKVVRVVPTSGIAEGFAALLAYDPESPAAGNAEAMGEAARRVVSGEVTRAVRDSVVDAGPIREGDHLGLTRSGIEVIRRDVADAAIALLDLLVGDDHEIVTVIEGEGATPAATRRITEWLAAEHPGVEAEVHHGGQPLYPYVFGVE